MVAAQNLDRNANNYPLDKLVFPVCRQHLAVKTFPKFNIVGG